MIIPDYFVTGIWKDGQHITDMFLHASDKNVIQQGYKVPIREIAALINKGLLITALKWDYNTGKWLTLCSLQVIRSSEGESVYCKYSEGNVSLDHLLNMTCIIQPQQSIVPLVRKRKQK